MTGRKLALKFKLLNRNAKLPSYSHSGDAGFDVCSTEDKVIRPGKIELISLGIASQMPAGWYVEVRDRSGLAANHGIHVLAGAIDSSYRGEWKAVLLNLGKKNYEVKLGERVAQGVLMQSPQARIVEVRKLSETTRGMKGFGSTGRK